MFSILKAVKGINRYPISKASKFMKCRNIRINTISSVKAVIRSINTISSVKAAFRSINQCHVTSENAAVVVQKIEAILLQTTLSTLLECMKNA